MALKIFFSHAWADKAEANVKTLMTDLKRNYDLWLDRYEIDLGDNINHVIEQAITDSDVVIVAWSRNASKSKHVLAELKIAEKYNKPVIPCIIDGFLNSKSKYIKDREWVEIKGNPKFDIPQLTILGNYLVTKQLQKLERSNTSAEIQQQIDELKEKQRANSKLIMELEDIHHRQKIGASGNESGNVYLGSALDEAINVASQSSGSDKVKLFFERMLEINKKYPGKEHNDMKVEYISQTIKELDPDGTDTDFKEFHEGALKMFNLMSSGAADGNHTNDEEEEVEDDETDEEDYTSVESTQPPGNYYDNEWFGLRLYIDKGEIQENYPNGCKVYFPGYGTATIYLLYNFNEDINSLAAFIAECANKIKANGTAIEISEFEQPSQGAVAIAMAYYNSEGQVQYEYLGGYCIGEHRGCIIEIISSDQAVVGLFREFFANRVYLLNEQSPGNKNDDELFGRLASRKLLSLDTSSSGYGSSYTASSIQKHFRLFENGEFDYYYLACSSAGGLGSMQNDNSGNGRWGVYKENGKKLIWFKWNQGQYELCTMEFGNDGDIFLDGGKYYIVSLDYVV
jgi:hypothetical protein